MSDGLLHSCLLPQVSRRLSRQGGCLIKVRPLVGSLGHTLYVSPFHTPAVWSEELRCWSPAHFLWVDNRLVAISCVSRSRSQRCPGLDSSSRFCDCTRPGSTSGRGCRPSSFSDRSSSTQSHPPALPAHIPTCLEDRPEPAVVTRKVRPRQCRLFSAHTPSPCSLCPPTQPHSQFHVGRFRHTAPTSVLASVSIIPAHVTNATDWACESTCLFLTVLEAGSVRSGEGLLWAADSSHVLSWRSSQERCGLSVTGPEPIRGAPAS